MCAACPPACSCGSLTQSPRWSSRNQAPLTRTPCRKYIKPYKKLFLLEPVVICFVYVSAMIVLPTFFACARMDCDADPRKPGCERVGLSEVRRSPL